MATIVKGKNAVKPYTVRYQDNGRQRERSFPTRRLADDFKAKFEHDSREGTFVDPRNGKVEFVAYAESYIGGLDRSPNTKTTYSGVLRSQVAPVIGTRSLAQVASDRELVQSLIANMTNAKGEPVGKSRKSLALVVILGTIREAMRAGRISSNRLEGLEVRRDADRKADIIPATEAQLRILADCQRPEFALLIWLMRGCGLRISEALAVRLDGFRNDGTVLRVSEQVTRDGKGFGPLKDRLANEYRDAPVPSWLWALVQAHVAEVGTRDGYLFEPTTYSAIRNRFVAGIRKAGLPAKFTPHHLRHLFVSKLLNAGVPITDVATWVGHRDIRITHAVYGHLLPDSWDRGRKALEAI